MTQHLLADQQAALSNFLDDLLTEDVDDTHLSPEEHADELLLDSGLRADIEPTVTALSESVDLGTTIPLFMDDGRIPVLPDWGLQPFQAMVFKVGELSLAIPLTELGGVVEWQVEQLQGSSDNGLFLGYYQHDGQSVRVVDTTRLVFAGSQFDNMIQTPAGQRVTRIILIEQAKWGLAVDAVHEVISIQPTRVNWRSTRTRRQWLAGTMLDEMIVVLDARSTAKILSDMLADVE